MPPRRMHPINESDENISGHSHLYQNMTDNLTVNAAPFTANMILRAIKTFIDNHVAPANPKLLSLLLYIKQLNESVTDLLRYNTATSSRDCQQILLYLSSFNHNIVAHLTKSQNTTTAPKQETKFVAFEDFDRVVKTNDIDDESKATFYVEPHALSKESSQTNAASEGKSKETDRDSVNSLAISIIKEEKKRKRDLEKKQREEMKRRNINENFNFFESYYVLKQETNYRLHSQQHYSGRLGLKNISRLQLLRLISNTISRQSDIAFSRSLIVQILKAVFFSKLSGKKFETISYMRFKKILNLPEELDKKLNISFFIYQNIKKYFEKTATKKKDAEHMYQGRLYIDRKFYIMNDILYGSAEYEQMFKVDDEKATEDEIYDAENYGDIYRIVGSKPPLLFKKIELECFDDLQSVLNEQYGLKIFDPNCQLYFGTECDFNDDGDEIEYISSRLIMTEYKGSTLAEKIYDYAEDNDHLREYDIGQILCMLIVFCLSLYTVHVHAQLDKILLAVQQTHRKNVIHCDLKPDNMIINIYDDGNLKKQQQQQQESESKDKRKKVVINLIDFGYCEVVKGQDFIIQQHLIKGTKGYIAPEIFSKYKYSKKSDIYAIGCIGFEMITGGTLPSDYDLHGNYVDEDDDDENEEQVEEDGQPQLLDIDVEGILNRENHKRPVEARVSGKLIKFISKLAHYAYDERYDVSNAVTYARKYWSNMKPVKHRTAFF